ncbi:nicotinamide-nucleotide adenylyltransferase [Candidatus Woesearchaeota archaeon]|nr:nicotinamide-nucleotide adenylyltransferase [Candidatus Woesearchaeota archaeon]
MKLPKRGLYLGRFQPFHNGHMKSIKRALNDNIDELIIMIGSAQHSYTRKNPFTSSERYEMIEQSLKYENIDPARYHIIPIKDINSNSLWVPEVELIAPRFEVVYSGNKLTKYLFAKQDYEIVDLEVEGIGTKIRDEIAGSGDWRDKIPQGTLEVMLMIDGEQRIKDLYRGGMR